jgi:hypothetical protein
MSKVQTVDIMNNQHSQKTHVEIFPIRINIEAGYIYSLAACLWPKAMGWTPPPLIGI